MKKHEIFKIGRYEYYAFVIIAVAAIVRILLASQGWPQTNSDEDTFGLMGIHIAYRGEHPVFLVGNAYMGSLEAYLGAAMFRLFGPSLFALRLGLIVLTLLFFVSIYLLTSLLYSKKFALALLVLLSLGSSAFMIRQMVATGGSAETLLFGSLAFLLASWLVLSYNQASSPSRQRWRKVSYACWGIVVGLGLWSDLLILPFVVMSGSLIVLFCWRELWPSAVICLLLGLAIGMFPLIAYNVVAPPGQDSLSVLWGIYHGSSVQTTHSFSQTIQGLKETATVSLPIATGNPFCPVWELSFLGSTSPQTTQCTLIRGSWGVGYILLWTIATCLTVLALWNVRYRFRSARLHSPATSLPAEKMSFPDGTQPVKRHFARLFLLCSTALTITLYAFSSAPIGWPGIHARYLIGLQIAFPAVLWPLWSGASKDKSALTGLRRPITAFEQTRIIFCRGMLLLIGSTFLAGTIITFLDIPANQAINQQQDALIHNLARIGATHIYSDYWTCNRIIFQSNEQITCGVLDNNLQPTHNRYESYFLTVKADPRSSYVFPVDSPQVATIEQVVASSGKSFQHFVFNGYVIYQPT